MTTPDAHRGLLAALTKAHACPTVRNDGSCDGCYVSEALAAWREREPLRDDPALIATGAVALRISDGRGNWSTDNLPCADVARSHVVLDAIDAALFGNREPARKDGEG